MASEVVLYDLDSIHEPKACWSINPWKARMALNYKGIPYRTEYLNFPSIKPTLSKLGIPPNEEGRYTLPAVRMPDGRYIMANENIAPALEELKPSPPLHLDSPMLESVGTIVSNGIFFAFMPEMVDKLMASIDPPSQQYMIDAFATRFQVYSLDEYKKENGGEKVWTVVNESCHKIVALLKEDENGPYFLGKEPSFSDMWLLSILKMAEFIGAKDLVDRILESDPVVKTWYAACNPWTEKNT